MKVRRLPDIRTAAGHILTPLLVATGWTYMILGIFSLGSPVLIANTGPGMQVIAYLAGMISGTPAALLFVSDLCTALPGPWALGDFLQAIAMWFAMVLAMMLPALMRDQPVPGVAAVMGYLGAWVPFCLAGTFVQWVLVRSGYLDPFLVSASPALDATVLLFIVATVRPRRFAPLQKSCCRINRRLGDLSRMRQGFASGVRELCVCAPLMSTMLVLGLMNVVAMAVMTALMLIAGSRRAADLVGFRRPFEAGAGSAEATLAKTHG